MITFRQQTALWKKFCFCFWARKRRKKKGEIKRKMLKSARLSLLQMTNEPFNRRRLERWRQHKRLQTHKPDTRSKKCLSRALIGAFFIVSRKFLSNFSSLCVCVSPAKLFISLSSTDNKLEFLSSPVTQQAENWRRCCCWIMIISIDIISFFQANFSLSLVCFSSAQRSQLKCSSNKAQHVNMDNYLHIERHHHHHLSFVRLLYFAALK